MSFRKQALLLCLVLFSCQVFADVKLPAVLNTNMVLQRGIAMPVWGWASPGEAVTVTLEQQQVNTTADAGGKWLVRLAPMKAGGPYDMVITGRNTIKLTNLLIGEVWVCSGQSNMAFPVRNTLHAQQEIADADYPQIRQCSVANTLSFTPKENCVAQWSVCSPKSVGQFTAVGYFFARELHKTLGVPIGIIHTSWGGTCAEAWTDRATLENTPGLKPIVTNFDKAMIDLAREFYKKWEPQGREEYHAWFAAAEKARAEGTPPPLPPTVTAPPVPSSDYPMNIFNGKIAPLIPYAIAGVAWYQGESNAANAARYRTLFPAMIQGWRRAWGQGDVPFLFVQLANFSTDPSVNWPELREAQTMALTLPKTGMAVAIDAGEAGDIHPRNKQVVGQRLALSALAVAYEKKLVYSGPIFKDMRVEGNSVRITFTHTGGGLTVKGEGPLTGFVIAGEGMNFVTAEARIEGDTVVVRSADILKPVAVRYAWKDNPECNLYNREGLPASPFRTDKPEALAPVNTTH